MVDPIDGTSNYVAGLPLFGVMAAVVIEGRTVAAAIHDPVCDDTAVALRGGGARLVASDRSSVAMRVAPAVPAASMTGAVSWRYMPAALAERAVANLPRLAASWDFRCAAHAYRMLAAGHCHYLVFHRLLPWDHLAGVLLHQEAGGFSARLDGTQYRPGDAEGGLICAPDEASWEALRRTLLE